MKSCSVCKRCFDDAESACIELGHGELADTRHSIDVVPGYCIERIAAESSSIMMYGALNRAYGQECFLSVAESNTKEFLADAKLAAGLFHAGIAGVVESGELPGGMAFAVSEGYEGQSLRKLIMDDRISLLEAIVITRQAAEAAQELHAAGLVHGAITPENISVRTSSEAIAVKLHNIDFGAVRMKSALSNRFAMQSAIGAIKYFAPEQIRDESVGPASDVYALGVLLYELLSGHPPFDAESASSQIDMQLHQKPPDIAIENFDLRMLLTHSISEALQKQPSFRQSTADLFARQMRHIEQLATHVPTPPPAVHVKPTRPAHPAQAPVRLTQPPPSAVESPVKVEPAMTDSASASAEVIFVPSGATKRSRLKGVKKRLRTPISPVNPPTLIGWQQPEDDIPSLNAVLDELEKHGAPLPETNFPDEEVTAVRPNVNRIEVDLAKPSAGTSAPEFLPTLLSTGRVKPRDDSGPSMFAAFQTVRRFRKLPIYSAIIAVTALAGVSILRIADRNATAETGYLGGNDPVAPIRVDDRITETKPAPIQHAESDEPAVGSPTTTDRPKPVRTEPVTLKPTKSTRPESQPAAAKIEPKRIEVIVPSTLVISTKGGRPTRTVLKNNDTETQPRSTTSGTGATRPRIVKTPD